MDKEVMVCVYICNGMSLSHKKKRIWVTSSEVEWEKQMLYINTHIWNLEKWYWWTYLQGRNTVGKGEGGMNWERSTDIYTLPYVR